MPLRSSATSKTLRCSSTARTRRTLFSPVYAATPIGPEGVTVTDTAGDVYGTQDFAVSSLGFPVDTFTGSADCSPVSSPLQGEYGFGYSIVLEESTYSTETSTTFGDS
jgi:hypothetical protein